jgi:hypothetical protein
MLFMTTANQFKILLLVLLLLPVVSWSQKKEVTVRIVQEQSVLLDTYETNILLEKKAFKIQVLLGNVAGLYVFAAFTDSICCRLAEIDSITGFADLPNRTMKEPEYNRDKELLVNDDNSCSYWFYSKGASWQGFNKKIILLDNDRLVALKTVKQLFYVPTQREIKLKEMNQPLYLLFVAVSESDSNGRPMKELMRRKVKIEWINED